jgi:hypothetical protein
LRTRSPGGKLAREISEIKSGSDYLSSAPSLPPLDSLSESELAHSIFQKAQEISDVQQKLAPSSHSTEVALDGNLPVGIAFTGDWHIGGGEDNARLWRDIATIGDTSGLHAIGMGDFVDGVSVHSKAVTALYNAAAIGERGLQNTEALSVARQAKGKWLAILEGNHDAWSERHASINCTRDFAKALDANYFHQGGGSVYINVGGIRYNIAVRHNAPGNSRLNTTNSQRRMFDEWPEWVNTDVIVLAHFHFCDLHQPPRKGGAPLYLRSGTYKLRDSYAANGGFTPEWGIPLAILYPDERRVIGFRGDQFYTGLRFLAGERDFYRKAAA